MSTSSPEIVNASAARFGLGCMAMSDVYGPSDEGEGLATIHAALDAGIDLLDSGDFYGMGHNELLLRRALEGRPRDSYRLSIKFGAQRDPAGGWIGIDTRPAALKTALAYSLKRLGTDYVDIYRPARLDPKVPIEETAGAVAELIAAGFVRQLGLSEVGAETIRRAHAVTPVADLQIEYSLITRGMEEEILPTLRELGIGVTAYGVLSRGLLSGKWQAGQKGDYRSHLPRFSGENLEQNLKLVDRLAEVGAAHGLTTAQTAIAWVLSRGGDIIPLIGARKREQLTEALGALAVSLTPEELASIEAAVPAAEAAGTRYQEAQMQHLDSERKSGDANA